MANLRGKGAYEGVNLIGVIKEGGERGKYIDFQVDQSLKNTEKVMGGESKADTNPHISSKRVEYADAKDGHYTSHDQFYANSQVEKMIEAAGSKLTTSPEGNQVIGIQANLMRSGGKADELIVRTDQAMGPTKNPQFGKNTLENQQAVTSAARDFRDRMVEAKAKSLGTEVSVEKESEQEAEL